MAEVPYGYCHCGCGERTSIAIRTTTSKGHVKGEPHRFVAGHKPTKRSITKSSLPCTRCKKMLPHSSFKVIDKEKGRLDSWCKDCNNIKRREIGNREIEGCGITTNKAYSLRATYGISPQEFKELLSKSNGSCMICGKKFDKNNLPRVDHCHSSGKVRGILCNNCNVAIGYLQDSVDFCLLAATYLKENHVNHNELEPTP